MSKKLKLNRFLLWSFFSINLIIIFAGWLGYSQNLLSGSLTNWLLALSRITGLLAVYFILWQLWLIGRLNWLEKILSLDKGLSWHHWFGLFTFIFILAHPIFVTLAYANLVQSTIWQQLKSFFNYWEGVDWAIGSLIIFVLAIIISLPIIKKKLKYEFWYLSHLFFYLAILLAFGHQLSVGGDFLTQPWFRIYWIALYTVMIGTFIIYRFIRPIWLWQKHHFVIEKIVQESNNVWSIYLAGKNLSTFSIQAGQFVIIRFLTKKLFFEAHPFSLSAVPDGKNLRITYKELGDHTKKLKTLKLGTKVIIDGPHGAMTTESVKSEKIIMVAGGIGVTPLRALAEKLTSKNKNINFFYSAKEETDFIFQNELNLPNINLHLYCSAKNERITAEKIIQVVSDWKKCDIFICGPTGLYQQLSKDFKKLGLEKNRLHFEKFSF